ncbi:hypothetical protein [Streptomyces sp. NPDC000410]|uniref:hypothetical protein n=1 Tax=Streptomyces sp. NPDC000410 TaxID=3154254 RepID=UPI003331D90A
MEATALPGNLQELETWGDGTLLVQDVNMGETFTLAPATVALPVMETGGVEQ